MSTKATAAQGDAAKEFQVGSASRKGVERQLRDLFEIGHLSRGPLKVDDRWDDGSRAAIEEFQGTMPSEAGKSLRMTPELLKELDKRCKELHFQILVSNCDEGRPDPQRLPNGESNVQVCWNERICITIRHPKGTPSGRTFTVEIRTSGSPGLVVSKSVVVSSASTDVDLQKNLIEYLTPEQQGQLPVESDAEVVVTSDDPYRPGRKLSSKLPISLNTLKNVSIVTDDAGRSWYVCSVIAPALAALKAEVNTGTETGKGKLCFASTLRTWSKQMELWSKYKRGDPSQRNPANQPGTSWHETARAIDISVWSLDTLKPPSPAPTRQSVDLAIVETEDVKARGRYFLAQLDDFRTKAKAHGFTLAGKAWETLPWNKGFAQSRHTGTIVAGRYSRGLKYVFRFTLGDYSANVGSKTQIGTSKGTIVFQGATGVVERTFVISENAKRCPTRVKGATGGKALTEIAWTVEAEMFPEVDFQWLNTRIANAHVEFTWTKSGKQFRVTGTGLSVKIAPEFVLLTATYAAAAGPLGGENAKPLDKRIQISGKNNASAVCTLNATAIAEAAGQQVTYEFRAKDIQKTFADFDPALWIGSTMSAVFEDRSIQADGRYMPAFQSSASEKHHFQNANDPHSPNQLDQLVKGLNKAVDEFNQALEAIPAKWKAAHPEATKVPKSVTNLATHWKMRRYEAMPIIGAAAYIGNVPTAEFAQQDLQRLANEIETTALQVQP